MKRSEKEELVVELFSNVKLFELKVLSVKSSKDRLEIIHILVKTLIRDLLKSELNFLYMQDLKQFKFSLIVNLLFKEIASEWLSYAEEVLQYSREESLDEIQNKTRVTFIYTLAKAYFSNYKNYFFIEIVNTFFELAEVALSSKEHNPIIDKIIEGELVKNEGIVVIQSYSQLLGRVRSAKSYKNEKLSNMQVKIAETSTSLVHAEQNTEEKKRYENLLTHYKNEKNNLELASLDDFDAALKRVKETMIQSMSQMKIS